MVKTTNKNKHLRSRFYILYLLLALLSVYIISKSLLNSLFFNTKNRINLVYYAEYPIYYSLNRTDNLNYAIGFYPNIKVKVPGGYGDYRIGALGKLVALEKQPDILRKTFSTATTTAVDYYFYESKKEIYYGKARKESVLSMPSVIKTMFWQSNARFFDRIFILTKIIGKKPTDFMEVDIKSKTIDEDEYFQGENFAKLYLGFFYNKLYRDEQRTVQLIYTENYKTAVAVSKLIEGNGIRIVDLSQNERLIKGCIVIEGDRVFSETAKYLSQFFSCQLVSGNTEISDIIFKLGEKEKEWEIK